MRDGDGRVPAQQAAIQVDGEVHAAALTGDGGLQVQRVGLIGDGAEHAPGELLRLAQVPGAVGVEGAPQPSIDAQVGAGPSRAARRGRPFFFFPTLLSARVFAALPIESSPAGRRCRRGELGGRPAARSSRRMWFWNVSWSARIASRSARASVRTAWISTRSSSRTALNLAAHTGDAGEDERGQRDAYADDGEGFLAESGHVEACHDDRLRLHEGHSTALSEGVNPESCASGHLPCRPSSRSAYERASGPVPAPLGSRGTAGTVRSEPSYTGAPPRVR